MKKGRPPYSIERYRIELNKAQRRANRLEIKNACLERENRDLRMINRATDETHEENRLLLAHIAHQERTIGKLYSALTLWSLVAQGRIEISPCPVLRIDQ